MLNKRISGLWLTALLLASPAYGQNLAEKLGYAKDARLLIIHADDLGVAHSENAASVEALAKSGINSASIMVPCPWFPEIAAYARANPQADLGLHLTLTAEWKHYKWDGVLPASEIPSLIGPDGFFYPASDLMASKAKPEEVEKEIRAQVQRAIDFGINPTHLDTHMAGLFQTPDLFRIYQKVGKEFGIPVMIPLEDLKAIQPLVEVVDPSMIAVSRVLMMNPGVSAEQWNSTYNGWMNDLQPGVNVLLVHLAYDDAEMQAVTVDHPDFGAAWRQRDLDYVLSGEFKEVLKKQGIELVTWRQIKEISFK